MFQEELLQGSEVLESWPGKCGRNCAVGAVVFQDALL